MPVDKKDHSNPSKIKFYNQGVGFIYPDSSIDYEYRLINIIMNNKLESYLQ